MAENSAEFHQMSIKKSSPTKFELNLINGLWSNAQKPLDHTGQEILEIQQSMTKS